jgi:uncharacterized protein (DUF608 family)
VSRREFVAALGAGAAAALSGGLPLMAGPLTPADFAGLVPADKRLLRPWVELLTARGTRTIYRGAELAKIGMPVGGLCAGQLYLGGDGNLWHWDIFNQQMHTGDDHYAHPPSRESPVFQGFALVFGGHDNGGWVRSASLTFPKQPSAHDFPPQGGREPPFPDVTFCGEYPIGYVEHRDPKLPIAICLEAFSPFIPLNTDDSSLPATLIHVKVKNVGDEKVTVSTYGFLGNPVCCNSDVAGGGTRENRVVRRARLTMVECSALPASASNRPEIVIDDFQKGTYEGWEVEGTAFGSGPVLKSKMPAYQGDVGGPGLRVVNSHAAAPGNDVREKDQQTGKLTSRPFKIERKFITFWIGGGNHPGKTCINLLVDGKIVRTATGHNDNRMRRETFDVAGWEGKTARLEIVDRETGPWGNIGLGRIAMTDQPAGRLEEQPDFGTMVLGLLAPRPDDEADCAMNASPYGMTLGAPLKPVEASEPLRQLGMLPPGPVACLTRHVSLDPGKEATATYLIAWHFPNLSLRDGGRHYASRFASARAVAEYVAENYDRLAGQTRLWHDTWYDSTLPYWFLDRTMANTSILATSTAQRFRNGRFWGWEGVGCCDGTCTHVWHYAQAVARLFPQLERDLRQRTDFGTALDPKSGVIQHRGEGAGLAVDGQAGCILRAYREHQMSASNAFLKPLWPKIKLAMEALVRMDRGEGLIEGAQHNTLDQPWFGKIAWLSSLYVAAARACEEMARELGDEPFAARMAEIARRGGRSIDRELFNGEYYLQIPDREHVRSVGSHNGCEIDQVFGQSWAHQLGLGRILDEHNVKAALAALWKYNFTPDVGPFRKRFPAGRWYAMAGEAGMLMCSWPKGDQARVTQGFDYYFNECMTGFEYQVAGHMLWEGMVTEGLAVARAVHDRYHASRRNPWNEIECGDHYARAMASYGVFLAACGYAYHGPKGYLAFAPRVHPEDFRAAFTAAEGWGTFRQKVLDEAGQVGQALEAAVELKWGSLRLRTLALVLPNGVAGNHVTVGVGGKAIAFAADASGGRVRITLADELVLQAGQSLEIHIA